MEVKIISTAMIKPSKPSASPHFNMSLLDQVAPPVFTSVILHYPGNQMSKDTTTADISRRLKTALSQSLVRFYPLAGRLDAAHDKDTYRIECNDEGVEFYEAKVADLHLDDFLKNPNYQSLSDLVPCNRNCSKYSGREDAVMAVQANFFDCGGLALGVSISHLVADATTIVTFLKSWASTTGEAVSPIDPCNLFPPIPGMPRLVYPSTKSHAQVRFVVDELNLAALRRKSSGAPTRVEAATALVSRCMARATKKDRLDDSDERCFTVSHAVNLRPRMEAPLSDDAFGNFWILVSALSASQFDLNDGRLEMQLRKTFKKVDATLAMELQGPERLKVMKTTILSALQKFKERDQSTELFYFTSWCKFPFYEVDFGWGKPQWITPVVLSLNNMGIFVDQKEGDGIEMWVVMEDKELPKFEQDPELLSYVSPPTEFTSPTAV